MGEKFEFNSLRKSIFQALFITGIPLFAYINFIDNIKFDVFSFFVSVFLCVFSVANMNVFFERKALFYIVLSVVSFLSGLFYVYIFKNNSLFFFAYILTYFNWGLYYIIRRVILFPDILLHFTGGILIFYLGIIWVIGQQGEQIMKFDFFDHKKILPSFFVSFAFTAGYIIDLIDDMEEDRKMGQKNLAEKIDVKLTFLLSSLMFLISYVNGFFVINQFISRVIFVFLFLIHFSIATILFLNNRILKLIPKYRNFYRFLFVIYCFLITFDNRKINLFTI